MRVFKEQQGFRQWWIILLGIGSISIPLAYVVDDLLKGNSEDVKTELIIALLMGIAFFLFMSLSLHTRIDRRGIKTWWEPFHFLEKEFLWKDLRKAQVREYKPIQEYGGWGIRGLGKIKAYNVSGSSGIQLFYTKGKFLIGTQKANEAKTVINKYHL